MIDNYKMIINILLLLSDLQIIYDVSRRLHATVLKQKTFWFRMYGLWYAKVYSLNFKW